MKAGWSTFLLGAALVASGFALAPRVVHAQTSLATASLPGDTSGARRVVKPVSPLGEFTKKQSENDRVLSARIEKRFEIKKLFRERGISYPAAEVFLRIFKRERSLELWVRSVDGTEFSLLKQYSICALAGELGPKRARGDNQTPEGFYYIDNFNPTSEFHLSLHLDYPNRADRALWKTDDPGGQIFIHGGCKTEGCLAVTDDAIKELYWIAVEARSAGQQRIPVHIFPARLDGDALFQLMNVFDTEPDLKRFWANLKTGFDLFDTTHRLPNIEVERNGRYRATLPALLGTPAAPDSMPVPITPVVKVSGNR